MSNREEQHGNEKDKKILNCDNLKVKIKTNQDVNTYVNMTMQCDVKCSLAQQATYARLMESAQKDEFGYGVGDKTLLDSYWARARRIAATYARFFLEEEDGCTPCYNKDGELIDLTGRFYWMGLGAFAVKTVACMFNKWQIKYVCVGAKDLTMNTVYEGLGKGNFWLFQDVGGWHHLYLLSSTTTPDEKGNYTGYEKNFIPCRDIKSADILCKVPKDIVKNKLPWADELDKIGNLARPTRIPNVIENSMEFSYEIERMMMEQEKEKNIHKKQWLQVLELAKHEQGNILQPLIYLDPYTPPSNDDKSMAKDNHATKIPKEMNVSDIFDKEHVYKSNEESHAVMQDWIQVMGTFPVTLGMPKVQVGISADCHDEFLFDELPDLFRQATDAMGITDKDELSHANTTSVPEDGAGIKLDDYKIRMKWIGEAADLCHQIYKKHPDYLIDELRTITGWLETPDQFEDADAATKIY